ncbi:MAG: hypothetical protein MK101_01940 [Phycisphaerales bacterium]|nr:hypothetical protein [Phycisphaerales bacterium]
MSPAPTTEFRHWRWAFVLTFIFVTVLTHLPRADVGDPTHAPPDKLIHLLAFGTIALLLVRCRWMPWPAAVTLLSIWIPFDEWTQGLVSPSRFFEWNDIISGWIGVGIVGVLADAMRPPQSETGRNGQALLSGALDSLTATPRGGLLPVLIGASVFFATAISVYVVIWIGLHKSEADIATLLAIGAGCGVTAGMMLRQWRRLNLPRLPLIPLKLWAAALLAMVALVVMGAMSAQSDLQQISAPAALFLAALIVARGARRSFVRACELAGDTNGNV